MRRSRIWMVLAFLLTAVLSFALGAVALFNYIIYFIPMPDGSYERWGELYANAAVYLAETNGQSTFSSDELVQAGLVLPRDRFGAYPRATIELKRQQGVIVANVLADGETVQNTVIMTGQGILPVYARNVSLLVYYGASIIGGTVLDRHRRPVTALASGPFDKCSIVRLNARELVVSDGESTLKGPM